MPADGLVNHGRRRAAVLLQIPGSKGPESVQVLQAECVRAGMHGVFEMAHIQADEGLRTVLPDEPDPVVIIRDPFVDLFPDPYAAQQPDRLIKQVPFLKTAVRPYPP